MNHLKMYMYHVILLLTITCTLPVTGAPLGLTNKPTGVNVKHLVKLFLFYTVKIQMN